MTTVMTVVFLAGVFGYLLWVRRYFFGSPRPQIAPPDGESPNRLPPSEQGRGEESLSDNLKADSDTETNPPQ